MKVWDAQTGQELLTLKGGGHVNSVAFSPDGHRLASDAGGTVTIWDATPLPEKPEEALAAPALAHGLPPGPRTFRDDCLGPAPHGPGFPLASKE